MAERRRPDRPLPIDPDVEAADLHPATDRKRSPVLPVLLAVIGGGGVIGALARYQVGRWWPTPVDGFPAATLTINLVGCLAIGVLLVTITERRPAHPLVRPFLVTGVLGGFTTFSTYALDVQTLLSHEHAARALLYLAVTAVGAVLAVSAGMALARRLPRAGR